MRKCIAIFDYKAVPTNAIGGLHRRVMTALCHQHDFVVFAVEFDNPDPERIEFVRIPVPTRPLALLFVLYHLLAPIIYLLWRIGRRRRVDIIHTVESNFILGDVVHAQFCHRAFLNDHWRHTGSTGLAGFLRWVDHALHALMERWTYARAKHVVAASQGLANELTRVYRVPPQRITIINSPIEPQRMGRPADFAAAAVRAEAGLPRDALVLVFVAAGQFKRKGFPLVLGALAQLPAPRPWLLVVGGTPDLVEASRRDAQRLELADQAVFVGMQKDVRRFLWAADGFIFPSLYEAFPLVVLEALGSGLPSIITPLNGVEDYARDGQSAYITPRSVAGVKAGIERFIAAGPERRRQIGQAAAAAVSRYHPQAFIDAWSSVYAGTR